VWSPKLDPCFAGFKLSIVGFLWGLSAKTIEREEREKKIERETGLERERETSWVQPFNKDFPFHNSISLILLHSTISPSPKTPTQKQLKPICILAFLILLDP